MVSMDVKQHFNHQHLQCRPFAPVPNKPTVSLDVKQHFNHRHLQCRPFAEKGDDRRSKVSDICIAVRLLTELVKVSFMVILS